MLGFGYFSFLLELLCSSLKHLDLFLFDFLQRPFFFVADLLLLIMKQADVVILQLSFRLSRHLLCLLIDIQHLFLVFFLQVEYQLFFIV